MFSFLTAKPGLLVPALRIQQIQKSSPTLGVANALRARVALLKGVRHCSEPA